MPFSLSFLHLFGAALLICMCDGQFMQMIDRRNAGDVCFMWYNSVAVLNNVLYIANGEYTIEPNTSAMGESSLRAIDLSSIFNVEAPLPADTLIYPFPAALNNASTPGTLWSMQDKLLLWKPNVSTNVLNAFDVPTKRWSSLGIDGDVDGLVGPALSSISAPDRRTSFALSPDLPGFVMLNASDPDHLTWTNTTTQGPRGIAVPAVWGDSEMVYVPLGQKGVLLVFGAYYLPPNYAQRSMDDISIYDIQSASWYQVTATAANSDDGLPGPRGAFCSVMSPSPDQSSYQITIYGGWNPAAGIDYNDVWTLTVPSFRWIKIDTVNDFEYSSGVGRAHHRCVIHNNSQMIVVGGSTRNGTDTQIDETMCRTQYPPLRLLDTSTYTWKKSFDPSGKYTVPAAISDVVGGGPQGGANVTDPERPWAYTDLETIMALNISRPTTSSTNTSSSPTGAASAATTTASKASHTSTGAIAGGVVGGLVTFAAIVVAVILIRRRHAKRRRGPAQTAGGPVAEMESSLKERHRVEAGGQERSEMEALRGSELAGHSAAHELPGSTAEKLESRSR